MDHPASGLNPLMRAGNKKDHTYLNKSAGER